MTLDALKPIAKALVGALIAGLGALGTALTDGTVSPAEWVAVALAALTVLAGVFAVPNRPAPGMSQSEVDEQSIQDDADTPRTAGRVETLYASREHYDTREEC